MTDELRETCERHRRIAREYPVTAAILGYARNHPGVLKPYCFKVTDQYHAMLMYETFDREGLTFKPPIWHAQIAVMEPVESLEFGAVREALVSCKDWTKEEKTVAAEVLGECLAPEIVRATQPVHMHAGLWDLHWFTPDENPGERTRADN